MNRSLLCLLFLLFAGITSARASGILSGELTYQYKGNNKYDVYARIVRDCNGINLSQSNVIAACSSATITISQQTKISTRDITPIGDNCPVASKCANGSFAFGFEEVTWKMELDLSSYVNSNFCTWTLGWAQGSSRFSGITTGFANQGFCIIASLDLCAAPQNSSPALTNSPNILLCHNQNYWYNMGVTDSVNTSDSLSYHLVPGLESLSSGLNYVNFTPTRPLNFFGFPNTGLAWPAGFHLDPVTGDLRFRPTTTNQVAVIVIEIKEWRTLNGTPTVVGTTRRDFVVIVEPCTNNIPTISPPFSAQFCVGRETCINISTGDNDQDDTVTISWNEGVSGATFTHNNGQARLASGQVCWTPHDSDVRNTPYVFTITARDDACNVNGESVLGFSIFVRDIPKAELQTSWLNCGDVAYQMTQLNTLPGYAYEVFLRDSNWNVLQRRHIAADTLQVPPGRHYLELKLTSATPCPVSIIDTLDIPDYVQVKLPSDTTVCFGDSLQLSASISKGQSPYSGMWFNVLSGQDLQISSPTWTGRITDSLQLGYRVMDGIGCSHADTIRIRVQALPNIDLGPDQVFCAGDSLALDRGLDSLGWKYAWFNGDTGQIYWVSQPGDLWLKAEGSLGCANSDTLTVHENAPYFEQVADSAACSGDTLTFVESEVDSIWYYELQPTFNLIGQGLMQKVPVLQTKDYRVVGNKTLMGTTCTISQDFTLTANPLPTFSLPADFTLCDGDSALISASVNNAVSYTWSDMLQSDYRWVHDSNTYILQVIDSNSCAYTDSVRVSVNAIQLQTSGDQKVCLGDSIFFQAQGADSLLWFEASTYDPGVSIPLFRGTHFGYPLLQESSWLLVAYQTAYGKTCQIQDTFFAQAHPQIQVQPISGNFNPVDTIQSYTYSVQSNGLVNFLWTVDQGSIISGQGTAMVNIQWNRTDSGFLSVKAWTADGCESESDSTMFMTLTSTEELNQQKLLVFPNPFKKGFTVRMEQWQKPETLELVNALGQVVYRFVQDEAEKSIELKSLPAGIYYLRFANQPNHGLRLLKE